MPVKVKGLREFIRASDHAGKETKKLVRGELREAAIPVKEEGVRLLNELKPPPSITVKGVGISVRRTGTVSVEERKGRTTGKRKDWGRRVQALFNEALGRKQGEVEHRLERAVDKIADRMENH